MIHLQLLGGVDVAGKALSRDAATPRRRVFALLALVASAGPNSIGREKLLGLLWPESNSEHARASLRQALFALRRDLGEEVFLPESAGGLQINPAHVTVDLWLFSAAIARHAPADAVATYRGPFLDAFSVPGLAEFSTWAEAERERLERQYLTALETLSVQAEQSGRHEEAVVWRRKQAAADPFSSRVTLALLNALVAAGDRVSALRYAAGYEHQIRQRLDANPDASVSDFVASLRAAGRSVDSRQPATITPGPYSADAPAVKMTAPVPRNRRRHLSPAWSRALVVGAAAIGLGTVAFRRLTDSAAADPPVIVLGTGMKSVAGRDPANQLIACSGPACPHDNLPQDAFVVVMHPSYAQPTAQSEYIAPVADGTTLAPPGYKCCTTAVFENAFTLPPGAIAGSITLSAYADNRATFEINGREFGRQTDSVANFVDGSTFTAPFIPDKSGINRLRVTLWDGGGALGLHYIATVTFKLRNSGNLTPNFTRK